MNTPIDTRNALSPYKGQRLSFEAVLVDITMPTKKNHYEYGLVFGAVYAPNECIELDHVVIAVNRGVFRHMNLELYKRYRFTAMVDSYKRANRICGTLAQTDVYMLCDMKSHRIREIETSSLAQPTQFLLNRIETSLLCESRTVAHTAEELLERALREPNDGSIEKFIDAYTKQNQVTEFDRFAVIQALTKKRH